MDYLIYGRAAAEGTDEDSPALDEAHWSYIVALDDHTAAQAFAENDPYNRAGHFQSHVSRRFENLLGRTMWEVAPRPDDVPFLVLADGGSTLAATDLLNASLPPYIVQRIVLWGVLDPAHGVQRDPPQSVGGMAVALLAADEATARNVIAAAPILLNGCKNWEMHPWEFGQGRGKVG